MTATVTDFLEAAALAEYVAFTNYHPAAARAFDRWYELSNQDQAKAQSTYDRLYCELVWNGARSRCRCICGQHDWHDY